MFARLRNRLAIGATTALLVTGIAAGAVAAASPTTDFDMSVSAGAKTCLANAKAHVHIRTLGPVEAMDIDASGLPANTDFDLFVIQVPTAPFGLSWYQGDLETDGSGQAKGHFLGRFNVETFFVAPGVTSAPVVFDNPPFPDASSNPAFNPIQTYHLGVWFNSPTDAQNAGCAATVTPFNGEHNAGIQVLNTATFAADQGPLRQQHN
jgi:hypothetical protein